MINKRSIKREKRKTEEEYEGDEGETEDQKGKKK